MDAQTSDNVNITGGCIDIPDLYVHGRQAVSGPIARISVMDPAYGAVCDGSTDDATAIAAAFTAAGSAGFKLTGNNRTCAVSSDLTMPDGLDLADIEFKRLSATNASRTLKKLSGSGPITLTNVKVNMNASAQTLNASPASGIYISFIDDVTLNRVEVYGGTTGRCLSITDGSRITVLDSTCRDMTWANAVDPSTEQIVGMFFIRDIDVMVRNPRVRNLKGSIASGSLRAYQTDGIDFAGTTHAMVTGAVWDGVGEAVDTYSSDLNTDIQVQSSIAANVGVGIKFGSCVYCGTNGVIAKDAGRWGFVTGSNSTTPVGNAPTNITFANSTAINTGSDGLYANAAGFKLDYDGTAGVTPSNIRCVNCQSISTATGLVYGFHSDISGGFQLINPYASGYTTAYLHDGAANKDLTAGVPENESQFVAISTGGTVTVTTPMVKPSASVIIDPDTNPIATATLTLPACPATTFGTTVEVMSRAGITALTVNAASGSMQGSPSSMSAYVGNKYRCRAGSWYRMF